MRLAKSITLAAALVGMTACGSSGPSPQLVDARKAYGRAEKSLAMDLAPDKLLTAKQALQVAERENNNEAGSVKEKHLAYLAERSALAAIAFGDLEQARRESDDAERAYRTALEKEAERARRARERTAKELAAVQDELSKKGTTLDARTKELKDREKELSDKQKELLAKQKALELERKKRLEAEARARAAIKSLEEIARVKEERRGIVITLSGAVLFRTAKAELLPLAQNKLGSVAKALQETDKRRQIVVEGHTDSRGSDSYNKNLSLKRAQSVRNYLVSQGVPSNRISAMGRGEDQPVANNRSAEGRANNRRVEIIVRPLSK